MWTRQSISFYIRQEMDTFSWKQYLILTCISVLIFMIVYTAKTKKDGKKASIDSILHYCFMVAYICFVYQLTIAGRESGSREGVFLLFEGYLDFKGNALQAVYEVLNILLFVPFGYLMGWRLREGFRLKSVIMIIGYSLLGSIMIEISQLFLKCGYFEMVDIVSNTIGGGIGALIFGIIFYANRKKEK